MLDQMRGDCIGLDGHSTILTPNMNEVGAKGCYFKKAYTTCASCIPARHSLLTGQYPVTSGMVGYKQKDVTAPTLPSKLKEAGYSTKIVGRNMHQLNDEKELGYEECIMGSTYVSDDNYQSWLTEKAPVSEVFEEHGISFNGWTAKSWHLPETMHPTNWTSRKSRDIVKKFDSEKKPLFLTTSFYAPHPPFVPPEFYMNRYLRVSNPLPAIGDWEEKPDKKGIGLGIDNRRTFLQGEALNSAQAGYYGLINHIDDQLYYLISNFKQLGRPWVIIVTSDHGEMLGDHYYFRKCEPYEGSSRIPLLIQSSKDFDFESGIECKIPVSLEDVMPTILELADISIPENVDGQSLVSTMKGDTKLKRNYIHAEHSPCYSCKQSYQMLVSSNYKYIWRPFDGSEQLFDLNNDPKELEDISSLEKYKSELKKWRNILIEKLKDRPEGFVKEGVLKSVKDYDALCF